MKMIRRGAHFTSARFVVTGGAGFIGSHLVERLVETGHDVTVLDDFSTGTPENLAAVRDRIRLVEASVTNPTACMDALRDAEFVLHQAALPSVPRSIRDPMRTHEVNATGTLNVLLAARAMKVRRVVLAGSSSLYGNGTELPKHEGMVPRPVSPYAVSKLAAEGYCRAFHETFGLETVVLRYFNVFGPRQDPNSQYAGVIARFMRAALQGDGVVIHGDGEQTRDFTYISNVVDANLLACNAADAAGECVNIGCGQRISVNEIWKEIAQHAERDIEVRYDLARTADVRDSQACLTRARAILGYEPTVDVSEGIARSIAYYRDLCAA